MHKSGSDKKGSSAIETMSLPELIERLEQVNQELQNLKRGFVPKHLCQVTITHFENEKKQIEAKIESRQSPSCLPTHG